MKHKYTFALFIVLALEVLTVLMIYMGQGHMLLFNPKGHIAQAELNLMIIAALLMLLVVVPVLVLTFVIAWRYRASNTKAKYSPNWDKNSLIEFIWWSIPCAIIIVLAILTWRSTYALDPYKPLTSDVAPLTVEVVALDWKWLFIYPEQHIASVNFLKAPVGVPINFKITADAPMNSLWIPQLGGQMYAMTGMTTKLHLIADTPGTYAGVSANISGKGFAGMKFNLEAVSQDEFDAWVVEAKSAGTPLTRDAYEALAEPSEKNPPTLYSEVSDTLFSDIVHSFMVAPGAEGHTMEDMHMEGMQMH